MIAASQADQPLTPIEPRSRGYLIYMVVFLGSVALMDGYLSSIKASAIPYISRSSSLSTPSKRAGACWRRFHLLVEDPTLRRGDNWTPANTRA